MPGSGVVLADRRAGRTGWCATAAVAIGALSVAGCRDGGNVGGESGSDTGPTALCELAPYPNDLALGGSTRSLPGDVIRVALAGSLPIGCGVGFVGSDAASSLLDGACTGIAADEGVAVVVTDMGEVVLLFVSASGVVQQSKVVLGGPAYDVALDRGVAVVAAGAEGLVSFATDGGVLIDAGPIPGATDALDVAKFETDWLVADGRNGIVRLRPDGTLVASLPLAGVSRRIVVAAERAIVLKGPHGLSVVDASAGGLALVGEAAPAGLALDAIPVPFGFVVASAASLLRYRVEPDRSVSVVTRERRREWYDPTAAWFTAIAGDEANAYAALGDRIARLEIGEGEPTGFPQLDRATHSLGVDAGLIQGALIVRNGGRGDLRIADVEGVPPLEASAAPSAPAHPDCEGQYVLEPGGAMVVELGYSGLEDNTVGAVGMSTNDPDARKFVVLAEVERPAPQLGDPAELFRLWTSDERPYRLADRLGDVVLLKLFNFT